MDKKKRKILQVLWISFVFTALGSIALICGSILYFACFVLLLDIPSSLLPVIKTTLILSFIASLFLFGLGALLLFLGMLIREDRDILVACWQMLEDELKGDRQKGKKGLIKILHALERVDPYKLIPLDYDIGGKEVQEMLSYINFSIKILNFFAKQKR